MPFSLFGKSSRAPAHMLEEGWQLYAKPTTLEPVGTLFRIDADGRRFLVDQVTVATQQGPEAAARIEQRVVASFGLFARFLGLDSYGGRAGVRDAETLEFEIVDPIREVASDVALHQAMQPVLGALPYRADNTYYVIRDTRSASAMTYRLTTQQLGAIGGEAALAGALGAGTEVGGGQGGKVEIRQTFAQRMRVMFLAEEIVPVKAGLAGERPELGLVPVTRMLAWEEGG